MSLPTLVERLRREAPWFGDFQKAADRIDELEAALSDVLRMLEAAHRQIGMHSDSNPRVIKARAALDKARARGGPGHRNGG
jgi:hypothetical protein